MKSDGGFGDRTQCTAARASGLPGKGGGGGGGGGERERERGREKERERERDRQTVAMGAYTQREW